MLLPVSAARVRGHSCLRLALCTALFALGAAPLMAQTLSQSERDEIAVQLRQLREQQAQIATMQQQTEHSIRALESRLGVASPQVAASAAPASPAARPEFWDRLKVSGDMRVRAQGDYSDNNAPDRLSGQVRARLGATFDVNEWVTVGARVVTGDRNDPNSTDVQLSNWDDGFEISLDLAYAQLNLGDLKLYGGKIPQPFTRTELVWDGDVNPQGVSAVYKKPLENGAAFRANGLFFAIDNQRPGPSSYMSGAQLGFDSPEFGALRFDASLGYYHYHLGSLVGADAGDWRSNRLDINGQYVSDYRLLDVIAGLNWRGISERWPLRVTADYVKNLGADDENTGFGVDVALGRASKAGDWRLIYGYAQTDVDAVMAAFSHDNTSIASNYKMHALTVDYTLMPKTVLGAVWYHYKPNNPLYAGSRQPDDWLDRLRVYMVVNF